MLLEIRYIQRRGRTGRKFAGRVIILASKDSIDQTYYYVSNNRVKKMKSIIDKINKDLKRIDRDIMPINIINLDNLEDNYEDDIKQIDKLARYIAKEVKKGKDIDIRLLEEEYDKSIIDSALSLLNINIDNDIHTLVIDKLYNDYAIAIVDDKYYARLYYDFIPREYLRIGKEIKCKCRLYKEDKLIVDILDIVR